MIEIENLTVRYKRFTAVDRLSLSVARGELFGFLGPNGAGKTTTIKVLTGQLTPSEGTARVAGLDVTSELDALKPRFGYVPDVDNHFEEFTAQRNLELFADFYGVPHDRIDAFLAMVELEDVRGIAVRNFSKGMKKKLLLARELLHDPDVLYLDEPTANLDVHSAQRVRTLLKRLTTEGKTVFMTTHDMSEAEAVCDRVAILNQGRLVTVDTPIRMKTENAERIVDVVYEEDGASRRMTVDMDDAEQRRRLADLLRDGHVVTLDTHAFDFNEVFLKLTGRRYT